MREFTGALDQTRSLMTDLSDLVMTSMPEIEKRRYDVAWKADGSPVTAADIYLENIIQRFLEERIEGLIFIGEESYSSLAVSDGEGDFYAIVDPIDGTENFCSGLKEWGVGFTLWKGAGHLGSMLLMPELNERLMTGDTVSPIRSRIRGFSSSICPEIVNGIAEGGESRLMGCAVYNLYNVVRGAYARFTNPRGAYAWDLLPGLMLALEHGCDVLLDGQPYDGRILASDRKYRVDITNRRAVTSRL